MQQEFLGLLTLQEVKYPMNRRMIDSVRYIIVNNSIDQL
jgi:hypothetical protein